MTISRTFFACTMMLASLAGSAPVMAVTAVFAPAAITGVTSIESGVEQVQYRGGRRGYGNRRGGNGAGIALGIGAAIIGGIVLSEAARAEHRTAHGGDWDRCAQTYRSFEPSTGLYTGYDGVRRTCPYLR